MQGIVETSDQLHLLKFQLLHPDVIGDIDEQRAVAKLGWIGRIIALVYWHAG